MNELERKKLDLQKEIDKIERQERVDAEKKDSFRQLIGKYFVCKDAYTFGNTTGVRRDYVHVIELGTGNWDKYVVTDRFQIDVDTSGWSIIDGEIIFKNPRSHASVKSRNRSYDNGRVYVYNQVQPDQVYQSNENGKVVTSYRDSSKIYKECTKEEFDSAAEGINKACLAFNETLNPYLNNTLPRTKVIDEVELQAVNDLVKKLDKGITLSSLFHVAKREALYNYFNDKDELPELVQYQRSGDKGLYLDIVGGDGGTDYEPYVTHYVVNEVVIKWEEILYPIRQKIKGKVFDLVAKLEAIEDVYYPSNWDCDYFGDYDVTFSKVSLQKQVLDKVNKVIKANLKKKGDK